MSTVKRMEVWVKVDREQCYRDTGKPPKKLRRVDINKGDEGTHTTAAGSWRRRSKPTIGLFDLRQRSH